MIKTRVLGVEFVHDGIIVDIFECPRCGKRHKRVLAQKFNEPVHIETHVFKDYLICPITNEPVILGRIDLSLMAC